MVAEDLLLAGRLVIGRRSWLRRASHYIVALFGAMQAGLVAVPLSVPQFGTHDERVLGALRDCAPVAMLTTSAVVREVMAYARSAAGGRVPRVIEIDGPDLDSPRMLDVNIGPHPKTAYLQYTSGSTRQPAGVVVSHRNVIANLAQIFSDYWEDHGKIPPPDTRLSRGCPFTTTWD